MKLETVGTLQAGPSKSVLDCVTAFYLHDMCSKGTDSYSKSMRECLEIVMGQSAKTEPLCWVFVSSTTYAYHGITNYLKSVYRDSSVVHDKLNLCRQRAKQYYDSLYKNESK